MSSVLLLCSHQMRVAQPGPLGELDRAPFWSDVVASMSELCPIRSDERPIWDLKLFGGWGAQRAVGRTGRV